MSKYVSIMLKCPGMWYREGCRYLESGEPFTSPLLLAIQRNDLRATLAFRPRQELVEKTIAWLDSLATVSPVPPE